MSFIAGAGLTNIDLLYTGMPRIPSIGEEVYSKGFELQLGGGTPATLINLGRLGIETRIATKLGKDIFSNFAKEKYAENRVEILNLYDGDDIPVNITSAVILKDDRSFITYGRPSMESDSISSELFYKMARGSKITLMQAGSFYDTYAKLHDEGSLLILDMGWEDDMSIEKYKDYLRIADYYTPNRKEALKMTGCSDIDSALDALSEYFDTPVIKLDKDGCIAKVNGEKIFVKSIDSFVNVDSTGAGDAFLAGFSYGVYMERPVDECLLFGNITGGKCVTGVGALTAYLTKKELLKKARKSHE